MQSSVTTVQQYLAALPADRRQALEAVRKVIRANLDPAFEEGIQHGMIGYYLPHSAYPAGYHCDPKQPLPFASLGSQANHMALYLFCIYGSPAQQAWFSKAWTAAGKRLDMGKSCVRFRKLEDVPLDVVGQLLKRVSAKGFVAQYEANLRAPRPKRGPKAKVAPKAKAAARTKAKATAKKAVRRPKAK